MKTKKDLYYEKYLREHSKDKEFILKHVDKDMLKFVDKELLEDKGFVLKILEINGLALKHVSAKLKNDKEVVMKALQNSAGFALKYASKQLRADRDVVNESIKKWKAPLKYASPELRQEALERIENYYKKHKI